MTDEQQLLERLGDRIAVGAVTVVASSDEYFKDLASYFPVSGSKIDWSKVPDAVGITARPQAYAEDCLAFFDKVRRTYQLHGQCIVMSDNGFHCALIMPVNVVGSVLGDVFDIPQHHYVVAIDYAWCIAFTTEGFADFGFCPAS